MVKVHYFYDPLCGWCYGATPLIEALNDSDAFELIYHPGGMVNRQAIETTFRQHILHSDEAIAEKTGALFGEAYKARIGSAEAVVFDSYIVARAVLVAEEMGLNTLTTLKAVQAAHYQQGRQIELLDILKDLAVQYGLNASVWLDKMILAESEVSEVIHETRKLMRQFQVNGYPALIAEFNGEWLALPHSAFYQRPSAWVSYLNQLV